VPIQHDVDDVLYGAVTATYIVDHMFRRTGGGTPVAWSYQQAWIFNLPSPWRGDFRRPVRSVGVITSSISWASGSRMSSRSTLVSSLEHLLALFEFCLVAPPSYRTRRALIGASSSSVGPMTTVRLCYRHEEGVVLRGLPSNVRKQITEATYQPRLPDLR